MSTLEILQVVQLAVGLLTLGGGGFALGRFYGRIDTLDKGQVEIRDALFGVEGRDGAFLRRSEAVLMQNQATAEHEAFDRRLDEFHERLGRVEAR